MRKYFLAIASVIVLHLCFAANPAQAWESWSPQVGCVPRPVVEIAPKRHCGCCGHRHHHIAKRVEPPPVQKVVEQPVRHETHIEEVVIVHHKVIEEPTVVIAPRPCGACNVVPRSPCNTCGAPRSTCNTCGGSQVAQASSPGQLLHQGCPAGVSKGDVFVCDGPTGKCICK